MTKNEFLQLQITQYEKKQRSSNHRREYNDNHYRDIVRRKRERSTNLKKQICVNYNHLVQWIRDCEKYIEYNFRDFSTKIEKIRWSKFKLEFNKKTQWRIHVDSLAKNSIWTNYIFYLKNRLSNATIRRLIVENNLQKTKQKLKQSISTFDVYLQELYSDLNYKMLKIWKKWIYASRYSTKSSTSHSSVRSDSMMRTTSNSWIIILRWNKLYVI